MLGSPGKCDRLFLASFKAKDRDKRSLHVDAKLGPLHIRLLYPSRYSTVRPDLYQQPVSAGFPSLAEDCIEGKLDLELHLVKNPTATFDVCVSDDKRLFQDGDRLFLKAENQHSPIEVSEPQSFCMWGVATSVIHLLEARTENSLGLYTPSILKCIYKLMSRKN